MKRIIFTSDELSQEYIIDKIKEELSRSKYKLTDQQKSIITQHSYAQIENVIDRITETDFSLMNDKIKVPDYEVDDDGYILFKDSMLKKSNMKYTKESILSFIDELCISATRYGIKGVVQYYGNR